MPACNWPSKGNPSNENACNRNKSAKTSVSSGLKTHFALIYNHAESTLCGFHRCYRRERGYGGQWHVLVPARLQCGELLRLQLHERPVRVRRRLGGRPLRDALLHEPYCRVLGPRQLLAERDIHHLLM